MSLSTEFFFILNKKVTRSMADGSGLMAAAGDTRTGRQESQTVAMVSRILFPGTVIIPFPVCRSRGQQLHNNELEDWSRSLS